MKKRIEVCVAIVALLVLSACGTLQATGAGLSKCLTGCVKECAAKSAKKAADQVCGINQEKGGE